MVSREIVRADSLDSAAAIVAISAPQSEKITVVMPAEHGDRPERREAAVRDEVAEAGRRRRPESRAPQEPAMTMKTMMAATLIEANQNSNSP